MKILNTDFVNNELTKAMEANSTLISDKNPHSQLARKTNCKLKSHNTTIDSRKTYGNLDEVFKIQSNFKSFLTHYHRIGFTNIH